MTHVVAGDIQGDDPMDDDLSPYPCRGHPAFIVLFYELYLPPTPDPIVTAVFLAVMLIMAAVLLTFGRLAITMTTREITVSFGLSKRRFGWEEVEDCYLDETSAARYGGYGIRGGIYNGQQRLVYNVTNAKRVVLKVRGKKYDEFVFSTRKPEQCMRIIRMQIGKPAT
jgi:hypothetical protein